MNHGGLIDDSLLQQQLDREEEEDAMPSSSSGDSVEEIMDGNNSAAPPAEMMGEGANGKDDDSASNNSVAPSANDDDGGNEGGDNESLDGYLETAFESERNNNNTTMEPSNIPTRDLPPTAINPQPMLMLEATGDVSARYEAMIGGSENDRTDNRDYAAAQAAYR